VNRASFFPFLQTLWSALEVGFNWRLALKRRVDLAEERELRRK
jgi:hypothetical protein